MSVRAKFKVDSVTHHAGDVFDVNASPVTTGSDENKAFWKWTPSGKLQLSVLNKDVVDQLKPGAEFYIDITLAG